LAPTAAASPHCLPQSPATSHQQQAQSQLTTSTQQEPNLHNYLNCVKTNMIQRQRKEESAKQSINVISRDKKIKNKIVQAHDGGFFSVFNAYISNLTWHSMNNDGALILPDWDISRLLIRLHAKSPKSFCYGKREDKNIWCNFFQPVYSLSKEKLNSEAFLYENSEVVIDIHNTRYEPFLTYKNAEELYKAKWFPYFRKQYHNTLKKNVFLKAHIQKRINTMKSNFFGRYMIGLHIAHPSHAMEQPSEKLPSLEDYINKIYPQYASLIKGGREKAAIFLPDYLRQILNETKIFVSIQSYHEFTKSLVQAAPKFNDCRKKEIGTYGEELSIKYEKKRVKKHPKWIAAEDDGAGYDLESSFHSFNNTRLFIEVKTTTMPLDHGAIYISRNEWETAKTKWNCYLFHIWVTKHSCLKPFIFKPTHIKKYIPKSKRGSSGIKKCVCTVQLYNNKRTIKNIATTIANAIFNIFLCDLTKKNNKINT
jgi:hypothetical protein